ncbi:MAG TPA: hypothetical protein VK712_03960 [Verrucomicrobiae bacterium]|nr:hypothetical protein [Verrucomicrobiae bacterium]
MPSPRAEALHVARSGEIVVPPPLPDYEPDSPEALAFVKETKEQRYGGLAQTIDLVFERVFEQRPNRPPNGLLQPRAGYFEKLSSNDPWQLLARGMHATFNEAVESIMSTPEYRGSAQFTRLAGTLDTNRYSELEWQLNGGVNTGVSSTLVTLRSLPGLVRHRWRDCPDSELGAIARHPASTILLRRPAKICMNRLLAAQSALSGNPEHNYWSDIDKQLDPEEFRLHSYADGSHSLGYTDFSGLEVPEGFTPHHSVPPVEKPTAVSDIVCSQEKTIGCPITLLEGRLAQLLRWGVDLVESRGLWNETWPPLERRPEITPELCLQS